MHAQAGGLVLYQASDPGNVGTLLRSAAAFGLNQIVCVGGVQIFGARRLFRQVRGFLPLLSIHECDDLGALNGGAPQVALVARDGIRPSVLPSLEEAWTVVGNEAHGLPDDVSKQCTYRLTLPMVEGVESLNAAVAGAIGCFLISGGHR